MKKKTINQVFTTNDYDIFKEVNGNRSLNKLHLKRLKDSISQEYIRVPIVVNEKYQIIDGQHRFNAVKELGKEVTYIQIRGLGLNQVHRLNTNSKDWKAPDYLDGYCKQGMEDYIIFKEFLERFQFGYNETNAILRNRTRMSGSTDNVAFRDGLFKVKDVKKAYRYAEQIEQVGEFYKYVSVNERGYRRRNFIYTMLELFENPKYNHKEFLKKLQYQSSRLVDCPTVEMYKDVISKIYNYNRPSKDKVAF